MNNRSCLCYCAYCSKLGCFFFFSQHCLHLFAMPYKLACSSCGALKLRLLSCIKMMFFSFFNICISAAPQHLKARLRPCSWILLKVNFEWRRLLTWKVVPHPGILKNFSPIHRYGKIWKKVYFTTSVVTYLPHSFEICEKPRRWLTLVLLNLFFRIGTSSCLYFTIEIVKAFLSPRWYFCAACSFDSFKLPR